MQIHLYIHIDRLIYIYIHNGFASAKKFLVEEPRTDSNVLLIQFLGVSRS